MAIAPSPGRLRNVRKLHTGHGPFRRPQKVSGRLASDDVTQDRLDIRSYIDPDKHGRNAINILSA